MEDSLSVEHWPVNCFYDLFSNLCTSLKGLLCYSLTFALTSCTTSAADAASMSDVSNMDVGSLGPSSELGKSMLAMVSSLEPPSERSRLVRGRLMCESNSGTPLPAQRE